MNIFKKYAFSVIMVFLSSFVSNAQSYVLTYQYDAAGNRISRSAGEVQAPQNSPLMMGHGNDVIVSPTETTDDVIITTTLDPDQTELRYLVSNLQGNVLAIGDITNQHTSVPFGNYVTGIYLLIVQSDLGIKTFKVIKQ